MIVMGAVSMGLEFIVNFVVVFFLFVASWAGPLGVLFCVWAMRETVKRTSFKKVIAHVDDDDGEAVSKRE
jgi:hypothetical protein